MSSDYHSDSQQIIEAPKSWWLEADSRDGFTAAAEREQTRMSRSKAARHLGAGMVVGNPKLGARGTR